MLNTKYWRNVPPKENTADIASHGTDPKCIPECDLWWNGPNYLLRDAPHWPKDELNFKELDNKKNLN